MTREAPVVSLGGVLYFSDIWKKLHAHELIQSVIVDVSN